MGATVHRHVNQWSTNVTGNEKVELGEVVRALYGHNGAPGLIAKVDRIDSRLDQWDGAITFIKTASSFVGLAGLAVLLRAVVG
jgi:hypothetical protein